MARLKHIVLTLAAMFVAAPALAIDLEPWSLTRNPSSSLIVQSWMSPEIGRAWALGYRGQGTTITVIDDFRSNARFRGNLGTGLRFQRHGEWVQQQAGMVAPSAALRSHDFHSGRSVQLARGRNTLNLSYGMFARAGLSLHQIGWSQQEASIINHARHGRAVVVKAAGNDAVAIGAANRRGQVDYLNSALRGTRSTIFVGALDRNGTPRNLASRASYSNFAGRDGTIQRQFLMVGVAGNRTGLYGTSFAAPIVSGYAAVLGSKFTRANSTQIVNQLLNTARRDTIRNYNPAIHGRGEASIMRALAPRAIR